MALTQLSNNLNLLMAESRINANELARRIGIPASSIKKIRNDGNSNPTLSTLIPIANFFSITVSQLINDVPLPTNSVPAVKKNKLPVISWSEAQNWPSVTTPVLQEIATEGNLSEQAYAIKLDENINTQFSKGMILLLEPHMTPQQHDYIVVHTKTESASLSLKQIILEDGKLFLKSLLLEQHVIEKTKDHRLLGVIMESRLFYRNSTPALTAIIK